MIFVSAGHHQEAQGATFQGFAEWPEASIWASLITYDISRLGGDSMVVPSGYLQAKTTFINSWAIESDLAVEIHFNSAADKHGRPVGAGSETLYLPGDNRSRTAALDVQKAMSLLFPPGRGVKEGWYRLNPENGPNWFLAKTRCTSLIIEPDFIHRRATLQRLRGEATRAIAEALVKFEALAAPRGRE